VDIEHPRRRRSWLVPSVAAAAVLAGPSDSIHYNIDPNCHVPAS
jgi:hypothetical protein